MFFSAVKKTAEVAGFIETEPELELVEAEPLTPEKQKRTTLTLQQVGHVRYNAFNPADDLATLQKVFGVLKDKVTRIVMRCPDCLNEGHCEVDQFEEDEEIRCSECGYEDGFINFDEGIQGIWESSITPDQDVVGNWRHDRQQLLTYYAALEGREGVDRSGVRDEEPHFWNFSGEYASNNQPLYQSSMYDWHKVCADWTQLCGEIDYLLEEPEQEDD